ncbi:tannase/feruloyl esterase family alpha/beta hydrolase [Pseudooceanicola sp. CBS1P-1]|uniref:Tannase/feruloyl esterase family alpha/beta hydrolase n=1 Tax=Pseudooceanicola albus TaxID=2692189 RepID=A0A6L7G808_9RHOB|nr:MULTISPECIES: tannase/feruloyl esterase family alpha/beta hydrolase [Pseudooceanicola]MBT9386033.1 tannase/feruloyl esterase family alpha/beta hydrolase [Pseudooceanicola endophyticus]MXN19546.1 tannase/feruloyl esterase family alpha/beta hydrolase [Pseudooceanicola albus]
MTKSLLLLTTLGAVPILTAGAARAMDCSVSAIEALALPGVTISQVAPAPQGAAACLVSGQLVTTGGTAPDGSAGFQIRLPDSWNGRFAMLGNGGLAGKVAVSANPVDVAYADSTGYVTAMTDLGHSADSILDASFALNPDGTPNEAGLADYYYRASHAVTRLAKDMARAVYGKAPDHAYLTGCSTGGRMAQVAVTRYPDDFDGVISGAAFSDISSMLKIQHFQINQLASPDAQLLPGKLPAINAAILANCDATDGVTDGLIQNPAACSFRPESLICTGAETDSCLTPAQAGALRAYFTAVHTEDGQLVYPGYAPVEMTGGFTLFQGGKEKAGDVTAAEPWGNDGYAPAPLEWAFSDHIIQDMVKRDPDYDVRKLGIGADGTIPTAVVQDFVAATEAGNGSDLGRTLSYLKGGGKMILYHGWGDHALSPFRTVRFVDDLARRDGGYGALDASARLFMVPGMSHCGGGSGPNSFNTLAALEAWVEQGIAPARIEAVKRDADDKVTRSMPLCVYPAEARYSGTGDVMDTANWSCTDNSDGLKMGAIGIAAGMRMAGEPTQ